MNFPRASGILLHPTSLPGRFGIGDLGPAAYRWVDFLTGAQQKLWQILPLSPTSFGDSPYQSFSAFAGNPYLVSPELLHQEGLLAEDDLRAPFFPIDTVDYGPVIDWKVAMLNRAYQRYQEGAAQHLKAEFETFVHESAGWLEAYALFMALKDEFNGSVWNTWHPALVNREAKALKAAREHLATAIDNHRFRQFLFFRQWRAVKAYANERNIKVIGDIPFFVAMDSADAWQNRELFDLDESGKPVAVAGVPPDYFSATGQLWGNPLFRWDVLRARDYDWWLTRVTETLKVVDILRIDHFRAFYNYWRIPAEAPTAETGEWINGPQDHFFEVLQTTLGDSLPIVAEDLGDMVPEVYELRDRWQLPGMKILQFAWDSGPANKFLPHNFPSNSVVYTGTHDNDTTVGWYNSAPEHERSYLREYLNTDGSDIAWTLMRLGWASHAVMALAPFQDALSLDTNARMNIPGTASGNWGWRYRAEALNDSVRDRLATITGIYGR